MPTRGPRLIPGAGPAWPGVDPQWRSRVAGIGAVQFPADAQRLAQPGRPAGQLPLRHAARPGTIPPRGPAGGRERHPLDHPAGPQQHRGCGPGRQADQVHAEMHAVGEVHVGVPRRAEHDRVPRGLAPVGMRGRIQRPLVGLHFGQQHRGQPGAGVVGQHAAEQFPRHCQRRAGEEVTREQRPGRGRRDRGHTSRVRGSRRRVSPRPRPHAHPPPPAPRRAAWPPAPGRCRRARCGRPARQ